MCDRRGKDPLAFSLIMALALTLVAHGRNDVGATAEAQTTTRSSSPSTVSANAFAPARLAPTPAWTAEGTQVEAHFGGAVCTAGDVNGDGFSDIIVGAPDHDGAEEDAGRVALYPGFAGGVSSAPSWTVEGDMSGARLGAAVSAAGDVNGDGYDDVLVGEPGHTGSHTGEGRALLYLGAAAGLSPAAAWIVEGGQPGAGFGGSVAWAGDVNGDGHPDVAIGAPGRDSDEIDSGWACIYLGSSKGLSPEPVWTAFGDQAGAAFGSRVASAGDLDADGFGDFIICAPQYDHGETDEGRVYVYRGSWSGPLPHAAWTAEGDQEDARFGCSAGTAGDTDGDGYADIVIGANRYDNGEYDEGRAYLYRGSSGGLAAEPSWTAEADQDFADFGVAVSTAGDVNGDGYADLAVGAASYDHGQADEGRLLIFLGGAAGVAASPAWLAEADQESAGLGNACGTAGDVNGDGLADVIVGADRLDNGQADEGWAAVFLGAAGVLSAEPAWTILGHQVGATLGTSVATGGDVNGDGYSDVIVSAPMVDNPEFAEGVASVYLGGPGGLAPVPFWEREGNLEFAFMGNSCGTAGDVNGDGYSDLIVPAYRAGLEYPEEGLVYVFLGSPRGPSTTPDWMVRGGQPTARLGCSAGSAGDVNGDGYSDVIIGSGWFTNDQNLEGRAFVYHGGPAGLSTSPDWIAEGNQAGSGFGYVVSTAGDVNRDGYSDVLVGAWQYDNPEHDEGRAFVYLGSPTGLSSAPAWVKEGNQSLAMFGHAVGTAGDVNGDGYSDIIVGSDQYSNGEFNEGAAFVYHGSENGPSSTPSWVGDSDQALAYYGRGVRAAGDVNGDGYSDVLIGAQHYDSPETSEGRAYLYLGSPSGLRPDPAWTTESNQAEAYMGYGLGTAGDVNGDGFSDVIIGTYYFDANGIVDAGRVDVFHGNSGGGLPRPAGQTRTGTSEPIWPRCLSDSENGLRLVSLGRTPAGRARVRLQYEVKRFDLALDGWGLRDGPQLDTGAPGSEGSAVELVETVSGLEPFTLYHWRSRTLADSPLFPWSPWSALPYSPVTEAVVRTSHPVSSTPMDMVQSTHPSVRATPSPFEISTTLIYTLPEPGEVHLAIFDVEGGEVAVLADRTDRAGAHWVRWSGVDASGARIPTGIYFARLRFEEHEAACKIVLSH